MPWNQGSGDMSKWEGTKDVPWIRVWEVPRLSWKVSHSPVLPTHVNCPWVNEVHWSCGEGMAAEVDKVRGVGQWGVT